MHVLTAASMNMTYFWDKATYRTMNTLMMEAVRSFERSVHFNETTWRYNLEGCNLDVYICHNSIHCSPLFRIPCKYHGPMTTQTTIQQNFTSFGVWKYLLAINVVFLWRITISFSFIILHGTSRHLDCLSVPLCAFFGRTCNFVLQSALWFHPFRHIYNYR
jgi:hypothetical protein